ncbi:MAG: N-acetylmuramoyl-L-alanine amidase [Armatimonadetes bacterium]|nr:N-acetylmuramoyl-L-alanine amidase [Armatimonadota bacterium]
MKVLSIICLALLCSSVAFAGVAGQKICIDPGHGGSDPGAVGFGLEEEDVNLDIGLRARDLFQLDGATVIMTRTSDVYVSLQGRCDIANNNGADRFLCTHCNAHSDSSANGTETFCCAGCSATSYDLRNKINPEMVSHMQTVNRGLKTADFYVLVNTNMPAILCEVAFITNAADNAKLASGTWRQEAARAYLHGTQSHYGEVPHDPVSDIIIDNSSGSFSCSANWATGTSAADKYGSDYRWRSTAATSDPATWTPNIPVAGSWTVYAWWSAGTNRSPNSAYQVNTTSGAVNVYVNQQTNGGQWNSLGTFNLGTGGYWVKKSCWASTGYVVIADAIKWHKN